MLNKLKSKQKGFTIIEVLIVLAIAGLILLIVFLAVPALQRNSRNTQIKNDASAVGGAISEFLSNNNGQLPTAVTAAADGTLTVSGAGGTSNASGRVRGGTNVNLGGPSAALNEVLVMVENTCNGNVPQAGSSRSVAITFNIEQAGGTPAPQCTEG